MAEKILCHGAEAIIIKKNNTILKKRIKKSYRIPEIDEKLRRQRTNHEARIIEKASDLIPVPKILSINKEDKQITMQLIPGENLSKHLDNLKPKQAEQVCIEIGRNLAKLHDSDLIHGDLTTSNMILSKNQVFFIDFGLAFHSKRAEDKAVDIHLLKQALEAKHFLSWKIHLENVLIGYKISRQHKTILEQLKKVESRGRYKN